jgi:hypothetical protein
VRRPGTGRFKIENPNQQRKYDLMARESDPVAVHPTLAAGVADTVTITNPNEVEVTIVNRTGTSEIYFTYSWTGIPTERSSAQMARSYSLRRWLLSR